METAMNNQRLLLFAGFLAFQITPTQANEAIQLQGLEACSVAVLKGPFKYPDACMEESMAMRMVTVDVQITKDRADEEFFSIEFRFGRIRSAGSIIQIFYTVGVMGKAQWFLLNDMGNIVVMPSSLMLPFRKWVEQGLQVGTFVRVVIIQPK
jgi:hypothetical protein